MEEYDLEGETDDIINFEPIQIKQNNSKYNLNIEAEKNNISFSINNNEQFPTINYIKKMSFKELKEVNKEIKYLDSVSDIYNYFQKLSNDKKLSIKRDNNIISLIMTKSDQETYETITLFPVKKDINLSIKDIYQELLNIKEKIKEIDIIKKENKELKEKIEMQNKEIKYLKDKINIIVNKSVIMKEEESKMIFSEIEKKTNKKIEGLKKLYQASEDGGDSEIFHSKCDNIPNTLVLIKSEGYRRFGGFTPIPWESEENYIQDTEMKTFVFSLDNKKIYDLISSDNAVYHHIGSGPCFGGGRDIALDGNPIKENKLYTLECSYDYKGDTQPLSEYQESNLKALEYEVFQIILK